MQRLPRLGMGSRGASAADDSANYQLAWSGQEGDEPTFLVVSMTTVALAVTAAQQIGRARCILYLRRNVDQDTPSAIAGDTGGNVATVGGELIFDLEVGITQAAASPHFIPLMGIEMQDGDSIVFEGGHGVDNAGAGFAAMWGVTLMGRRKRQRKDNTR